MLPREEKQQSETEALNQALIQMQDVNYLNEADVVDKCRALKKVIDDIMLANKARRETEKWEKRNITAEQATADIAQIQTLLQQLITDNSELTVEQNQIANTLMERIKSEFAKPINEHSQDFLGHLQGQLNKLLPSLTKSQQKSETVELLTKLNEKVFNMLVNYGAEEINVDFNILLNQLPPETIEQSVAAVYLAADTLSYADTKNKNQQYGEICLNLNNTYQTMMDVYHKQQNHDNNTAEGVSKRFVESLNHHSQSIQESIRNRKSKDKSLPPTLSFIKENLDSINKMANLIDKLKQCQQTYHTLNRSKHDKDFTNIITELTRIKHDNKPLKLERAMAVIELAYKKEQDGPPLLGKLFQRTKQKFSDLFAKKINSTSKTHHYPRMLALIMQDPQFKTDHATLLNINPSIVRPTRQKEYDTISPPADFTKDIQTLNASLTALGIHANDQAKFIPRDLDNFKKYGEPTLLPNWRIRAIANAIAEGTGITTDVANEAIKTIVSQLQKNKDVDYISLKNNLNQIINEELIDKLIGDVAKVSNKNQVNSFIKKLQRVEIYLKTITNKERALLILHDEALGKKPGLTQ